MAEKLQDETYMGLFMCMNEMSDAETDSVIAAFVKVWDNLASLRG